MRTRDIQVGKVGAVTFVEVVVAIVGGVVARGYHRREQVPGFLRVWLEVELVEDAAEDADMPEPGEILEVKEGEEESDGAP